jgi:hypothetical protein
MQLWQGQISTVIKRDFRQWWQEPGMRIRATGTAHGTVVLRGGAPMFAHFAAPNSPHAVSVRHPTATRGTAAALVALVPMNEQRWAGYDGKNDSKSQKAKKGTHRCLEQPDFHTAQL